MILKFHIVASVLLMSFIISSSYYKFNRPDKYLDGYYAEINGRRGKIVSDCPYDLRITINTERLIPLPKNDIRWYVAPNREWITDWRWNFRIYTNFDLEQENKKF